MSKIKQKKFSSFQNGLYIFFINYLLFFLNLFPWFFRNIFYRLVGAKIAENVFIDNNVYIKFPWKLSVGKNTTINRGVGIYPGYLGDSNVAIGDNVLIGPNVQIYAASHDTTTYEYNDVGKDIYIGKNSWIGANSIILSGVNIGQRTIVAAGSVVVSDAPNNCIIAGNPAKIIKRRSF